MTTFIPRSSMLLSVTVSSFWTLWKSRIIGSSDLWISDQRPFLQRVIMLCISGTFDILYLHGAWYTGRCNEVYVIYFWCLRVSAIVIGFLDMQSVGFLFPGMYLRTKLYG